MQTDSQLKTDILAELRWEPSVTAAHIGVTARDGVVTLPGHVGTYAEKRAAETAMTAPRARATDTALARAAMTSAAAPV